MSSRKKKGKKPLYKVIKHCLRILRRADSNTIFYTPVDVDEVPQYLDVITKPMDFQTAEAKLEDGKYKTLAAFKSDIELIWSNCMKFNEDASYYFKIAQDMKKESDAMFLEKADLVEQEEPRPPPTVKTSSASTPASTPAKLASANSAQPARHYTPQHSTPQYRSQSNLQHATPQSSGPPKRKYVKSGRYKKLSKDGPSHHHEDHSEMSSSARKRAKLAARNINGAGVINDFGMSHQQPTAMDLLTIWDREQELHLLTGRGANERTDDHVENASLGPLDYGTSLAFGFLKGITHKIDSFHADLPQCKAWAKEKIAALEAPTTGDTTTGNRDYKTSPELLAEVQAFQPTFDNAAPFGVSVASLNQLTEFLAARPDLCCPEGSLPQQTNFLNAIQDWVSHAGFRNAPTITLAQN